MKTDNGRAGFTIVELLIVIVVIGVLAAITIVAYSNIVNNAKGAAMKADIAQWKNKAAVYRAQNDIDECPDNYVFVYGNSTLGTSDFCVMKYEAKIQGNDDGATAYNSSMIAESRPTGTPWVNITQTQAIAEAIAIGGHVLTEAEWMTIAADVLSVKYNWSGGAVGSGVIYQGHVNNNPSTSLAASTNDDDNLFGITGGIGTASGTNSSRVLYLSSGDAVWDFPGNVWEWTQQDIGTPTKVVNGIGVPGDSKFAWRDYTNSSLSLGNLADISKPATLSSVINPVTRTSLFDLTWEDSKGLGGIYANYADNAPRAFERGGDRGNGSHGGVLALSVDDGPSFYSAYVGFRVAR